MDHIVQNNVTHTPLQEVPGTELHVHVQQLLQLFCLKFTALGWASCSTKILCNLTVSVLSPQEKSSSILVNKASLKRHNAFFTKQQVFLCACYSIISIHSILYYLYVTLQVLSLMVLTAVVAL